MIGLILVSHGRLAEELLQAAEHVIGPMPAAKAIGLDPKDDLAERRSDISAAVDEVNSGAGVVIMTDLFGGTPSNLAIAEMARDGVDVVTGVNLPMLMKLARSRQMDRRAAVEAAVEAGRRYIMDAAAVLDVGEPKQSGSTAKEGA